MNRYTLEQRIENLEATAERQATLIRGWFRAGIALSLGLILVSLSVVLLWVMRLAGH